MSEHFGGKNIFYNIANGKLINFFKILPKEK